MIRSKQTLKPESMNSKLGNIDYLNWKIFNNLPVLK